MAGRERGQPAKRLRGHALDLARGTAEQRETVESERVPSQQGCCPCGPMET